MHLIQWRAVVDLWQGASPCFLGGYWGFLPARRKFGNGLPLSSIPFAESERNQWGSARTPSGNAKTRLPSLPILLRDVSEEGSESPV